MVAELLDILPYKLLPAYPHMGEIDASIWERFIKSMPDVYSHCRYDVAVGPGPAFDPTINPDTGADVYRLYQRRIDVVGFKDSEVDIIEVKRRAGPSAAGQVKFYRRLYMEDYKPERTPKCIVITDELLPGMAEYCADEGVQLVVI